MDRSKPLDLLAATARTGLHQGLKVGRIVVRRAGQVAATGATRAKDAVDDYRARRRPTAPLEAFIPSPRKPEPEAEPEAVAQAAPAAEKAGPSPADVAKRVTPKPPAKGSAKAPATKAASKPVKKSVPGAKLPPRRREEPATGE